MSEKRYIHIRNWERYQHDKRRTGSPWHKEHAAQLDNDAYLGLSLAQRGLLSGLRLMYGRRHPEGILESHASDLLVKHGGDSKYFRRHLAALSDAGFIVVGASRTLAPCAQPDSSTLAQEVEVEVEQKELPSFQSVSSNGDRKEGSFELEDEIIVVVDDGIDEDYRF